MSQVWSGSLLCRVIDPRPIPYLEHWLSAEWNGVGLVPVTGKILRESLRLFLGTRGKKGISSPAHSQKQYHETHFGASSLHVSEVQMDISVMERFVEEFDCRCMCNLQTGVLIAEIWRDLCGQRFIL